MDRIKIEHPYVRNSQRMYKNIVSKEPTFKTCLGIPNTGFATRFSFIYTTVCFQIHPSHPLRTPPPLPMVTSCLQIAALHFHAMILHATTHNICIFVPIIPPLQSLDPSPTPPCIILPSFMKFHIHLCNLCIQDSLQNSCLSEPDLLLLNMYPRSISVKMT